nr:kynureninase [Saprospiraceae bacterium]
MNITVPEHILEMDRKDPLASLRNEFNLPAEFKGKPCIYLCGNSLGLQPKKAGEYVRMEMEKWAEMGVEGHVKGKYPWMPYHEFLTEKMSAIVGGEKDEVVVMNSLSVNLHLLMVSFYRPTPKKYKILIEYNPFPSDRYAVESQAKFHGIDPADAILELKPEKGTSNVSKEHIERVFEEHGHEIAMTLIGGVNYYSGQYYDIPFLTQLAHRHGAVAGFDLAHGAGNVPLQLHDWGVDFAAWCSYKYLNSGPGAVSGVFVHQRHKNNFDLPRFAGWWGHDKESRFEMGPEFIPIPGAEGWQLSNPPILPMACMQASLEIFDRAGMKSLRQKSEKLTALCEKLINDFSGERIELITPTNPDERGSQLSIRVIHSNKKLFNSISQMGVVADWREPDVIRIAPAPLYNTFEEVYRFCEILKKCMNEEL